MKKLICILTVLLLLCGCSSAQSRSRLMLNTTVQITLYGNDNQYFEDVFSLCDSYEKLLSRTNTNSEVYKINHSKTQQITDAAIIELLALSKQYYQLTNGKFDVTIGAVSSLWDFNNETVPNQKSIENALNKVGMNNLEVDSNTITSNGCMIDFGAVAKGYIADKLKQDLISKGVKKAVLNLGGNVTVFGEEYTVGVRRPFSENEVIAKVSLSDKTVATSGVYERCFEQNGVNYHHILDAKTGYSAKTDLLSATVICENGAVADALSTVCILMGKQKAIEIIEQTNGVEAILVDENYNLFATSGLTVKNGKYFIAT